MLVKLLNNMVASSGHGCSQRGKRGRREVGGDVGGGVGNWCQLLGKNPMIKRKEED